MSEESRNPTFRIDKKDQKTYRELTGAADKTEQIVTTMKDVFLMAAAIGIEKGNKTPLSSDTTGPFRWHNLSFSEDIPVAKALALAASEKVTILTSKVSIRDCLEQYANWGIKELASVLNKPGDKKLLLALYLQDHEIKP